MFYNMLIKDKENHLIIKMEQFVPDLPVTNSYIICMKQLQIIDC